MLPQAFPLSWPQGWNRTEAFRRSHGPYRVNFDKARRDLVQELGKLGAQSMVISTNLELRLDGSPRLDQGQPSDPGVAVWWTVKGQKEPRVLACDRWNTVTDNLRAIGLAVVALRAIERSGASQILERAQQSFDVKALPAGGPAVDKSRPWWFYRLQLRTWPPTQAEVLGAYRKLAKTDHPDHGGDTEALLEVTTARRDAETWLAENHQ